MYNHIIEVHSVLGTFQTFQLRFVFFLKNLGRRAVLCHLLHLLYWSSKCRLADWCSHEVCVWLLHWGKTRSEDSLGTWKAVEAVRNPNSWYPWAGHRHSLPHQWQSPSATKSMRMKQGRKGWGKGKAQTDGCRKWSLFSGSANVTICMGELDLHLAQQFIKPYLLMSQTSLSEVMFPWPLPLIIYSTVQLLMMFFKMEL